MTHHKRIDYYYSFWKYRVNAHKRGIVPKQISPVKYITDESIKNPILNATDNKKSYIEFYDNELLKLVYSKDKYIFEAFDYKCP